MEDNNFTLFGLGRGDKIFFTGIGGYSMSGLASICHSKGLIVAGSDMEKSHRTEQLEALGIKIYHGHDSKHIEDFSPSCLVYSVAVPTDNPELVRARQLGIRVLERSYFLGGLNKLYKKVINIAGTHGKTTTTTLCALMLEESGLDPTAHVGALVGDWKSAVRIGKDSNIFVSEACEYNSSFLRFYSTTAAILNIDHDHVDCFPTIEDVIDAFVRFANTLEDDGILVIPTFDKNIPILLDIFRSIRTDQRKGMPRIISFGHEDEILEGKRADFYLKNYLLKEGLPSFDVYIDDEFACHVQMAIPGEYNAMNALAAIACSVVNGADPLACTRVIENFHGADNRFNLRGKFKGADIYSDYAHHPSAIRAAYKAAKDLTDGDVWAIFQPITYDRVTSLFPDFVKSLGECQQSILFEVYTSRANDKNKISSRKITNEINAQGGKSIFVEDFDQMMEFLEGKVKEKDIILFMGPEMMQDMAGQLTDKAN